MSSAATPKEYGVHLVQLEQYCQNDRQSNPHVQASREPNNAASDTGRDPKPHPRYQEGGSRFSDKGGTPQGQHLLELLHQHRVKAGGTCLD